MIVANPVLVADGESLRQAIGVQRRALRRSVAGAGVILAGCFYPRGGGLSCYNGSDHNHEAARLRPWNIASGIGVLAVYAYGVVDGILGYRRRSREQAVQPFVAASPDGGALGIRVHF